MGKYHFIYIVTLCVLGRTNANILNRNIENLSEEKFSEIKNSQCGGVIELDSGNLIYPGDGLISPGELCIWTIHLRTMDGFRMNFTSLDLPGGNADCDNSAVSIYSLSHLIPGDNLERYRFCNENNNGGYHFLTGNIATVVFSTSSSLPVNSSSTGFSLHWEGSIIQPVPVLHSSSYTSSPSGAVFYPIEGEYPPSVAMTWLVNGAGQNNASSLIIDILSVNFESCSVSDRCLCEALIIYDISQTGELQEVDRFCGERSSALLANVNSHFIVAFYSDNVDIPGEGLGFQIDWRQQPTSSTTTTTGPSPSTTTPAPTTQAPTTTPSPTTTTTLAPGPIITTCGGTIEGESGTIEYSLNEVYPYNARCIWTIRLSPAYTQIELTKVISGFEYGFDFLAAFSFAAGQGLNQTNLLGRTTDDEERVVMTGSVVILQFTSDDSLSGTGFRLTFRAVGAPQDLIRNGHDYNTGTFPNSIDYPEGDASYQSYELSTFVISTNYSLGLGNLQLTIDSYSLENSSGCVYDALLIYNVEKDIVQQLARYCGASSQPMVQTPASAFIVILFSDSSNQARGFEASWVSA